ncbi:hypothetical protein LXA43DRAFT_11575 [Ganoderma leucocontextum]|nr:hypothetical protein LXA43DRAFT_11575 [Ganoderma leucocontextum]
MMPQQSLSYLLSPYRTRSSSSGYDPLPSASDLQQKTQHRYAFRRIYHVLTSRRRLRIALLVLGILVAGCVAATTYVFNYPLPPLYRRFHEAELKLPQHDPSLPLPEGRNGRYLWVANHASKCGWGNAMQELFLNAYLAYRTNRAFVFDNYTWSRGESDYSVYNLEPIPSRIPLTALIQGPIVGAHFPAGSGIPRAVTPEYFYEVCQDRAIIGSYEVNDALLNPSAETLVQKWMDKMEPHRCVEVARSPPEIFDEHVFADAARLVDIWPHFSQSPIVQSFGWSTLAELAFDNNRDAISPTSLFEPTLSSSSVSGLARYAPIPGLLVLHVRRGDFKGHCHDVLARRSIGYTGFNSFPALPDHWRLPEGISEREKNALYTRHCFPDISMIVERVEEIRRTGAGGGLTNVYIMTNGSPSWVSNLKAALRAKHPWAHVASSRDLVLTPEQKYVSQALDVLVAQRAQVFIGNGFSTLSGMAMMLRMANGVAPDASRHW